MVKLQFSKLLLGVRFALPAPMFTSDSKIKWGMSEKKDGTMLFALNNRETGFTNQCFYFKRLWLLDGYDITRPFIAHGNTVAVVNKNNFFTDVVRNVDGLITKEKNLILTMTAGDCLPVYFYDPKKEVIGIAHAGWRGTVLNIVGNMIDKMQSEFGSNPEDILVHVGPHIKDCHFTVKDDIISQFLSWPDCVKKISESSYAVNLSGILKSQLLDKKVLENNISIDLDCTFCNPDKYFSYRRDKPAIVEAMVAYMVLK